MDLVCLARGFFFLKVFFKSNVGLSVMEKEIAAFSDIEKETFGSFILVRPDELAKVLLWVCSCGYIRGVPSRIIFFNVLLM